MPHRRGGVAREGRMDAAGGLDDQGSRSCNTRDEMVGDIGASRPVGIYTGTDGH